MPAPSASISAAGLADAGEHDPCGIAAGGDDARELAAGDDVEAAAEAREEVQDSEVGIGLERIADEMGDAPERLVEGAEAAFERRARVHVARRAEALGDRRQRHAFGVELAVDDGECGHGAVAGGCGAGSMVRFAAPACAGESAGRVPVAGGVGSLSGPLTPQADKRRDRQHRQRDEREDCAANRGGEIT